MGLHKPSAHKTICPVEKLSSVQLLPGPLMSITPSPPPMAPPSRRGSAELPVPLHSPPLSSSLRASSVLSSVVPYLRRDETPVHHKTPLVSLKLSSHSFLDSTISDDATRQPLYAVNTSGTTTTVMRSDPWEGLTNTAEINWPRVVPAKGKARDSDGVLVQMQGGRWVGGESVLRPGSLLRCLFLSRIFPFLI